MISVAEALTIVLQHLRPLPPQEMLLTPAALGRILAEDIVSDLDMPPYDKAMMDGYAIRGIDLPGGRGTLAVIEEITAGRIPQRSLGPGQASRIMTGAPIPSGADAVVMIEHTKMVDGNRVVIESQPPTQGLNIMPRGKELRAGEIVLNAGAELGPAAFGLLATVGRTAARLVPSPRVAVATTGDELVEPAQKPQSGQIRNSNGPMLMALTGRAGCQSQSLGIVRDEIDSLRQVIEQGLRADVLILSGGVSMGTTDLVPKVLNEAGVAAHVHKVAMKPGKPIFFGIGPQGTVVFGLPGNPVSSLVCFELFVRPALRRLGGHTDVQPRSVTAALAEDFQHRSNRPTYHPAILEETPTGRRVQLLAWLGSSDLKALTQANTLAVLPPGETTLRAGQVFDVLQL